MGSDVDVLISDRWQVTGCHPGVPEADAEQVTP